MIPDAADLIIELGTKAQAAAPSLAAASEAKLNLALVVMAEKLLTNAQDVLAANAQDVDAAQNGGMTAALIDRLRLDNQRLTSSAEQLRILAAVPFFERDRFVRTLDDGFQVIERRRPVGVIGANFEARPAVTLDVASQLIKSRNAGVLRTGAAAIRSALAIQQLVIAPALPEAGLSDESIQVVSDPRRDAAVALVGQPKLIPLVVLRGSGESTRSLGLEAAKNGVRTLAHADGGGVMYVDRSADLVKTFTIIKNSVDRLGVCNRLNLLLIDEVIAEELLPQVISVLGESNITAALPPHQQSRGIEWALQDGREATVTVDTVASPVEAAEIANRETSGLAASVQAEDKVRADEFIEAYGGTGVFWNTTTRLLDGYKLLGLPETGINVDHVPGPRGPVTFGDLYLRQFVVVPG